MADSDINIEITEATPISIEIVEDTPVQLEITATGPAGSSTISIGDEIVNGNPSRLLATDMNGDLTDEYFEVEEVQLEVAPGVFLPGNIIRPVQFGGSGISLGGIDLTVAGVGKAFGFFSIPGEAGTVVLADVDPNNTTPPNAFFLMGKDANNELRLQIVPLGFSGGGIQLGFDKNGLIVIDPTSSSNTAQVKKFSTDGTLASNSDTVVPTEKAIRTYVTANAGVSERTQRTVTETAHGFAVGNVIAQYGGSDSTPGNWHKAQGDTLQHAQGIGIVTSVPSANSFVVSQGYLTGLSGFSGGTNYYVSPSTAGTLTTTKPTTTGQVDSIAFHATGSNRGYLFPNLNPHVVGTELLSTQLDTDGTLSADSDTRVASQKATKTYVDGKIVTPAGSDTQVQFNDGGVFGAEADFAYDKTTNSLKVGGGTGAGVNLEVGGTADLLYLSMQGSMAINNTKDATLNSLNINFGNAQIDSLGNISGANLSGTNTGDQTLGSFGITSSSAELNILDGATLSTTELNYVDGVTSAIQTQIDAKQPLDRDLTTIAGLTATTDNIIQSKAGAWSSRTPTQFKTDLALVKGDVGLGNVDNTSDATKNSVTATLSNKRKTPRVFSTTSTATLTPEIDTYDAFSLTALTTGLTIANHSTSTPTDFEKIEIRLFSASAQTLTFGTNYVARGGVALPTTTVAGKMMTLGFEWVGGSVNKYNLMALGQEV